MKDNERRAMFRKFQLYHGTPNAEQLIQTQKPRLELSKHDNAFYTTNIKDLAKSYGTLTTVTLDPKIKIINQNHLKKMKNQANGYEAFFPKTFDELMMLNNFQNEQAKNKGYDAIIKHDIGNIGKKHDGSMGIVPSKNFVLKIINPDIVTKIEKL